MAQQQSTPRSNRGFAAMDQAKQREIASKGGKAAHLKGTAHEFTPEEARMAGQKGGQASRASRNNQLRGLREQEKAAPAPSSSPENDETNQERVAMPEDSGVGRLPQ